MTRILEIAKNQALLSQGVGRNKNYRVGAVLFDQKGRIHAKGFNTYKTHPILAGFTLYPHIHAESSCLLHRGLDNCSGLSLLAVRVKQPNNQITMAKPCEVCYNMLSRSGVKKIYYTDWIGNINQMET